MSESEVSDKEEGIHEEHAPISSSDYTDATDVVQVASEDTAGTSLDAESITPAAASRDNADDIDAGSTDVVAPEESINDGYDHNGPVAEDPTSIQDEPVTSSPPTTPATSPSQKSESIPPSLSSAQLPLPGKSGKGRGRQYIAIFLILIVIIVSSIAVMYQSFGGDLYPVGDKVAVIYIQGAMITGSVPGGLGYATSESITENIRKAARDDDVRAIVLRINSGGGSPAAAEEIGRELQKVQDEGIPVVVSMGDVAASAAYHVSSTADVIMANPSTMTGSIGVIWTFRNMSAYYEEEGIDFHIAKSGEFKDMGGTWRGLTDEEREYADTVILDTYGMFVDHVAQGRNMTRSEVKDIADGRIYTGNAAKELGLVDEFGNLYDAIDRAAELGDIEGDPTVYYLNRPSISSLIFGADSSSSESFVEQFVHYFENNPFGKITA